MHPGQHRGLRASFSVKVVKWPQRLARTIASCSKFWRKKSPCSKKTQANSGQFLAMFTMALNMVPSFSVAHQFRQGALTTQSLPPQFSGRYSCSPAGLPRLNFQGKQMGQGTDSRIKPQKTFNHLTWWRAHYIPLLSKGKILLSLRRWHHSSVRINSNPCLCSVGLIHSDNDSWLGVLLLTFPESARDKPARWNNFPKNETVRKREPWNFQ